jgi:hypothetical protein
VKAFLIWLFSPAPVVGIIEGSVRRDGKQRTHA